MRKNKNVIILSCLLITSFSIVFVKDTLAFNAPELIYPLNYCIEPFPVFEWTEVVGTDEYWLQIADDFDFTSYVEFYPISTNFYQIPYSLGQENIYFWRVQARLSSEPWSFNWSDIGMFFSDLSPPFAPNLITPINGSHIATNTNIYLEWETAEDIGSSTYIHNVNVSETEGFETEVWSSTDFNYASIDVSLEDLRYYWHVQGIDNAGNLGEYSSTWTFVIDTINPDIDSPNDLIVGDFEYTEITWIPTDLNPHWYNITLEGMLIDEGVWGGGEITIDFDDLTVGEYELVCTVYDLAGNFVNDSIIIEVVDIISEIDSINILIVTNAVAISIVLILWKKNKR